MKVNLLPRTNIEESLNRLKTKNIDQHEKELKNLFNHLNINSFNSFEFEKLDPKKIYSINYIKSQFFKSSKLFKILKSSPPSCALFCKYSCTKKAPDIDNSGMVLEAV